MALHGGQQPDGHPAAEHGQSGLTETFTVTVRSADGTEQKITVTIHGVDDNGNAVITGDVSGSVTEDAASILTTIGKLAIWMPVVFFHPTRMRVIVVLP